MSEPEQRSGVRLGALLAMAAPYRVALSAVVAVMVLDAAASLAVPWIGGRLAGSVLAGGQQGLMLIVALLAVLALQAILRFASDYLSARAGERMLGDLTCRLYDHLQSLPLSFFQQRRRGDVLALITYDVTRLSDFITQTLPGAVPRTLTAAGAIVAMGLIDVALAAMIVLLVPLYYLVFRVIGRRLRPMAAELQRQRSEALAMAEENLELVELIKTFTGEARESARHRTQVERVRTMATRVHGIEAALAPAMQLVAAAMAVAVLWIAGTRVGSGALSLADVVSLSLYAALLAAPISSLASLYGQVQSTSGVVLRLQQVLDETPEEPGPAATGATRLEGRIEFRDISFAYPGRVPALNGLDLVIRPGETVAITGANGAGKSTLVHLLLRLIAPQSGDVLVDGRHIGELPLAHLRGQIAVVSQRVKLFNASVRANIAYGRPDADDATIAKAARRAQAHDFITALPAGYDTLIGDDGVRLSGGQRQRIALARAILKDAPIVVLDEATAMFDPEGERDFLADSRAELITHRPASLMIADRGFAIRDGKAIEVASTGSRRAAE